MTFGKLLVSLQSERDEEDFTERKIHIKEEKVHRRRVTSDLSLHPCVCDYRPRVPLDKGSL